MAQKGIGIDSKVTVDRRTLESAARQVHTRLKQSVTIDGRAIEGISRPLGKITGQADEFTKSLAASNARVIAFGASVAIINGVSDAFKSLLNTTIQVEKTLTDINVVLGASQRDLKKFGSGIFDVARNTAQSFDTVAEGALEFARQGLSMEESLKRINDALILTRLTGLDVTESVEGLTAAVNTFKREGITTGEVINKLAELDIAFAVSSEDLIKGLERAGGSAGQARVRFEELAAMIAVVQERTARGGSVIGNALRTIFARLQGEEAINAVEKVGVAVRDNQGNFRSTTRVIEELSAKFVELDDVTKADIIQKVAGKRQRESLIALFDDMQSGSSRWAEALETVASGADTAYRKNELLNETLDAMTKQTGTTIKEIASRIGEIGLQDNLKELVEGFNWLLDKVNALFDPEEGNKLATAFMKGIGSAITSAPVISLLLAIFGKLTKDVIGFGIQGLKSLLGLNKAAKDQLALQESILHTLMREPAVLEQLTKQGMTRQKQEQFLLETLKLQSAEYAKLAAMAKSVTPVLFGAGARAGKGGITVPTTADGYIPNAAKTEADNIRRGVGGAKAGDRPVFLQDFNFGNGKRGPLMAHSGEYIVDNYNGSGGSAVFNRDMVSSMGMPSGARPVAAGGYIPNFASPERMRLSDTTRAVSGKRFQEALKAGTLNPAQKAIYARHKQLTGKKKSLGKIRALIDPSVAMVVPHSLPAGGIFGETTRDGVKIKWAEVGFGEKVNKKLARTKDLERGVTQYSLDAVSKESKILGQPPSEEKIKKLANQGAISSLAGTIFETAISSLVQGFVNKDTKKETSRFDFYGRASAEKLRGNLFPDLPISATNIEAKIRGSRGPAGANIRKSMADKVVAQNLTEFRELKKQIHAAASGYIPNFADPLHDAISREKAAGIPVNQIRINRDARLMSAGNPQGLAVTNTRDEPTGKIPNFAQGDARSIVGRYQLSDKEMRSHERAVMKNAKAVNESTENLKKMSGGIKDNLGGIFALQTVAFGATAALGSLADESNEGMVRFSQAATEATSALISLSLISSATGGKGGLLSLFGLGSKFMKGSALLTKVLPVVGSGFSRLVPVLGQALFIYQALNAVIKGLTGKGIFDRLGGEAHQASEALKELQESAKKTGTISPEQMLSAAEKYFTSLQVKAEGREVSEGTIASKSIQNRLGISNEELIQKRATNLPETETVVTGTWLTLSGRKEITKQQDIVENIIKNRSAETLNEYSELLNAMYIGGINAMREAGSTPEEEAEFKEVRDQKLKEMEQAIAAQMTSSGEIMNEEMLERQLHLIGRSFEKWFTGWKEAAEELDKSEIAKAKTRMTDLRVAVDTYFQNLAIAADRELYFGRAQTGIQKTGMATKDGDIFDLPAFEITASRERGLFDIQKDRITKVLSAQGKIDLDFEEKRLKANYEYNKALQENEKAIFDAVLAKDELKMLDEASAKALQKGIEEGKSYEDLQKTITGLTGDQVVAMTEGVTKLNERKNILKAEKDFTDDRINQEEKLARLAARPKTFGRGLKESGLAIREETERFGYTIGKEIPFMFRDNMADALSSAVMGAESLGDALRGAATSFLTTLQQAFMKMAVSNMMMAFGFPGMAEGGLVKGGSGIRDDVPRMLMDGEYVVKKDAVRKYGVGYLDSINSGGPMQGGGEFMPIGHRGQGAIGGMEELERFANQRVTSGATDIIKSGDRFSSINLEPQSRRLTAFGMRRGSPLQQLLWEQQGQAADLVSSKRQHDIAEKQRKKEALKQAVIGTLLSFGLYAGTSALNNWLNPSESMFSSMGNQGSKFNAATSGFFKQDFGALGFGGDSFSSALQNMDISKLFGPPFAKGGPSSANQRAMLTGGEYVVSRGAVREYGKNFFDSINSMSAPAPRFQTGGQVGAAPKGESSGETNISITVNSDGSQQTQAQGRDDQSDMRIAQKIRKEVVRIIEEEKRVSGALSSRRRGV